MGYVIRNGSIEQELRGLAGSCIRYQIKEAYCRGQLQFLSEYISYLLFTFMVLAHGQA